MRFSGLMRLSLLALGLAALPLASGCGGNPFDPPIDDGGGVLPIDTPLNDTPQNTMVRFERSYENQVLDQYTLLLTSDFRFVFSNDSDPELVTEYGLNWGKDDEIESTSHLFRGFTNDLGAFVPGAADLILTLNGPQFIDDPTKPDSGAYYKQVIVPTINLDIAISGGDGYAISAPHNFYLLRGDVPGAQLDANQPATADRWYIWRWEDQSPRSAAIAPRLASLSTGGQPARLTWGHLKASYAGAK